MPSGIVMKITDKAIVLLCDDGKFRNVALVSPLPALGERIALPVGPKPVLWKDWKVWVAAASVLFMALGLSAVNELWIKVSEPMAMVAVDINPSLLLGIDREQKVMEVRRLNKDAEVLLPKVTVLYGKTVDEALEIIIQRAEQKQYLVPQAGKDLVRVTVMSKQEQVLVNQSRLSQKYEDCTIEVSYAEKKAAKQEVAHPIATTPQQEERAREQEQPRKQDVVPKQTEAKQQEEPEQQEYRQESKKKQKETEKQEQLSKPEPIRPDEQTQPNKVEEIEETEKLIQQQEQRQKSSEHGHSKKGRSKR